MIRKLINKDLYNFLLFCEKRDLNSDFYIVKDNNRLFLNNLEVAKKVFNNCILHGDKCFIYEENDLIKGCLLIVGYSDKSSTKFIKTFGEKFIVQDLFRYLIWHFKAEAFIQLKKKSPIVNLLNNRQFSYTKEKDFGFQFISVKNQEIIFKYIPSKRDFSISSFFQKDEDNEFR